VIEFWNQTKWTRARDHRRGHHFSETLGIVNRCRAARLKVQLAYHPHSPYRGCACATRQRLRSWVASHIAFRSSLAVVCMAAWPPVVNLCSWGCWSAFCSKISRASQPKPQYRRSSRRTRSWPWPSISRIVATPHVGEPPRGWCSRLTVVGHDNISGKEREAEQAGRST
jgi:hypothetical protein